MNALGREVKLRLGVPLAMVAVMWLVAGANLATHDALDAFGIHGVGGMVGALLTGVFADPKINSGGTGFLFGHAGQIGVQAYGIVWTILWSALVTAAILKAIDLAIGLRVTREVEIEGLDLNLHGEVVP
jgi:Amt family ammonium transporter